jgi:hypothetical protein
VAVIEAVEATLPDKGSEVAPEDVMVPADPVEANAVDVFRVLGVEVESRAESEAIDVVWTQEHHT